MSGYFSCVRIVELSKFAALSGWRKPVLEAVLADGVTGNTSDFGSEESRFEPWSANQGKPRESGVFCWSPAVARSSSSVERIVDAGSLGRPTKESPAKAGFFVFYGSFQDHRPCTRNIGWKSLNTSPSPPSPSMHGRPPWPPPATGVPWGSAVFPGAKAAHRRSTGHRIQRQRHPPGWPHR